MTRANEPALSREEFILALVRFRDPKLASDIEELLESTFPASEKPVSSFHRELGTCHPKLSRGIVWCHSCGKELQVDSGRCLAEGWPKCCGSTMSIDSPDERAALEKREGG